MSFSWDVSPRIFPLLTQNIVTMHAPSRPHLTQTRLEQKYRHSNPGPSHCADVTDSLWIAIGLEWTGAPNVMKMLFMSYYFFHFNDNKCSEGIKAAEMTPHLWLQRHEEPVQAVLQVTKILKSIWFSSVIIVKGCTSLHIILPLASTASTRDHVFGIVCLSNITPFELIVQLRTNLDCSPTTP